MATIPLPNVFRALDISGIAVPGAQATFYDAGTTQERIMYADPECTIPHPSPVVADGAGVFPAIYDAEGADLRVAVQTSTGAMLPGYPIDPVAMVTTETTGASTVQFSPTVEIPMTNVQAAIERVQENILEPLADFGLGVTGNAPVIANLNDGATASGFYRADGTTTGTFPSGVAASNGPIVMIFRRDSSHCLMLMLRPGVDRIHYRRLSGGSWQSWRRLIDDTDTLSQAAWRGGSSNTDALVSPAKVMDVIEREINSRTVGRNQSWQTVTGSRSYGTIYTNNTSSPIMVSITADADSIPCDVEVSPPGSGWTRVGRFGEAGSLQATVATIVPPGHRYRISGGNPPIILYWAELR